MAQNSVAKIKPIRVDLTPPDGYVLVGHTTSGKKLPIYERTVWRPGKPTLVKDEAGKQVWEPHPTTAKPLYQRSQRNMKLVTEQVVPDDQGNGNLGWMIYTPATAADQLREQHEKLGAAALKDLSAELVKRGVSVTDFVSKVLDAPAASASSDKAREVGAQVEKPAGEQGDEGGEVETEKFPRHMGANRWLLSNGARTLGNRAAAEAAEASLHAELPPVQKPQVEQEPVTADAGAEAE